jgi:hypothetical protein
MKYAWFQPCVLENCLDNCMLNCIKMRHFRSLRDQKFYNECQNNSPLQAQPSVWLSARMCNSASVYPSVLCLTNCPAVHPPYIRAAFCPTERPSDQPSDRLSVHPPISPSVRPPIRLPVRPSSNTVTDPQIIHHVENNMVVNLHMYGHGASNVVIELQIFCHYVVSRILIDPCVLGRTWPIWCVWGAEAPRPNNTCKMISNNTKLVQISKNHWNDPSVRPQTEFPR